MSAAPMVRQLEALSVAGGRGRAACARMASPAPHGKPVMSAISSNDGTRIAYSRSGSCPPPSAKPFPSMSARLTIREQTVKVHLSHIYAKLGVDGRLDLLRYAEDKGLL